MVTSAGTAFGHQSVVLVGGAPLSADGSEGLESVVVDLAVGLPAAATLRFRDADLDALSTARLQVGAPVAVKLNKIGETTHRELFTGEVTALEYEYDARGALVTARCHDALHKLTRGRRTRSWTRTTEAAVARAVLAGAGLPVGTVEGRELMHEHVAQLDVSDWEFLSARARAAGRVLVMADGKAHLRRRPTTAMGTPVELLIGKDLERLRVRVTNAGQVPTVEVEGWNPATQRAVTSTSRPTGSAARTGVPHARLKGRTPLHVGDPVLDTVAEARSAAEGLAVQLSDVHAELEGVAGGDPRLRPGVPVRIKGTGPTHDGTYVLTRVQHVSDRSGYTSRIECGGGADRTLRGLVGGGSGGAQATTPGGNRPVAGVTVAVVTDVKDPARRGRVKVKFPWLSGTYATDWIRLAAPGAGEQRGLAWLPEVHDEVLVAFEHGDVRMPFVLGGLWSSRNTPPLAAQLVDMAGRTQKRALRSRTGQRLVLSDETGQTGALLASGDDTMRIELDGALTTVTVDSKGRVVVRGALDVDVKAGALLRLEGTAGVQIKGPTVSVEGTAAVAITGGVIKLN